MKQNNYKPQIPDVMEAIFDVAYLIFDLRNPDPDPLRRRCVSSGAANPESCTRKQ